MKKCLISIFVLLCTVLNIRAQSCNLILEDKQELPKTMKNRYWNLLAYEDGKVLACDYKLRTLTLSRFDKNFNVFQEVSVKKLPENMAMLHAGDQTIDGIFYDKSNVVHIVFDKQTLQQQKQEVLFTQEKYRSFAFKYTDIYTRWSENGKYLAVFAIWDHSTVGLAFSSNHIYLYNDKFEPFGHWSVDEDKRCVSLGSRENAGLWEHYYPALEVTNDGTVVYAALHDIGSNIYSDKYGTGSKLNIHILSKDKVQDYDFGEISDHWHLQNPCIIKYDDNSLTLKADYCRYPPNGINFNTTLIGYKILTCKYADKSVEEKNVKKNVGFGTGEKSLSGILPYAIHFPGKGYVTMESRHYIAMDENFEHPVNGYMGSAYSNNLGPLSPLSHSESNNSLIVEPIGNTLFWIDDNEVWDSKHKPPYTTMLICKTFTFETEIKTSIIESFSNKQSTSISCCKMSENKYLLLIDKNQWGTLELK